MNEMTPSGDALQREKLLYRYSSSLERGDFDTVAAVLQLAENDSALERMISEINQAYQEDLSLEQAGMNTQQNLRNFLKNLWTRILPPQGQIMPKKERINQEKKVSMRGINMRTILVSSLVLVLALFAIVISGNINDHRLLLLPALSTSTPVGFYGNLIPAAAPTSAPADTEAPAAPAPVAAPAQSTSLPFDNSKSSSQTASGERLIIHTGSLLLTVTNTRQSQTAIENLVAQMANDGAFVVSSNDSYDSASDQPIVDMDIRVPAARFSEVMNRIAGMAVRIMNRSESAQDITSEYVDVSAREQELETARQRLIDIMQNAKTTEDLLNAERELTQRDADLAALKGQMQYFSQSAQLSSINVELRASVLNQPIVQQGWQPNEAVHQAVSTLINSLQGVGNFLILFVIAILPWLLVVSLITYGITRLVMWRRKAPRRD
ncbi:MAG: DUF4349 domain-containing protein [Anaerolineaceae bacterium]|nr:DUF4349 domain-containing protein [Anaerolineaceae bacterium]